MLTQSKLSSRRAIFWVAIAVRVIYILAAHTYRISPIDDHALFGREMGRIARSLATGAGFSDPFEGHTGPSAWVSPLYPLLLAGTFRLFGVYSAASAFVVLFLDCIFSSLTVFAIYAIGMRCLGRSVAVWAAWIWALYPPSMQFATRTVWETPLSGLLFSLVFLVALRLRGIGDANAPGIHTKVLESGAWRDWLLFGLLWGVIALTNPALLIFLPACGVWLLAGLGRSALARAAVAAVICLLLVAPWMIRNTLVFHRFVPLRSNAGVELYLGNGPSSNGLVMEFDHPFVMARERERCLQLGEVEYARQQGRAAMATIRANPPHFVKVSLLRIFFFWFGVPHEMERRWDKSLSDWLRVALFSFTSVAGLLGLALAVRKRMPAAPLFASVFIFLPLTYYFVFVHARFRYPLEPFIALLGVLLFQSATRRKDSAV